MNCASKAMYLSLLHKSRSFGKQASKMGLYHVLRCMGARLYSNEAWMKSSLIAERNIQLKQNHFQDYSTSSVGLDMKGKLIELSNKGVDKIRKLVVGDPLTSKNALRYNAVRLYLSCTNALIYNEFQNHLTLPNSFSSWHKLVALHIWILMTRLTIEGKPGQMSRNFMIQAFHDDVEQKIKDIGDQMEIRVRTEEVDHLNTQFHAALFAFDEGLLNSDRDLAGALWRMLFMQVEDVSPHDLETMVQYVRKNVKLIHGLDRYHLLANGLIPFLPVEGDTLSQTSYKMLENVAATRLKNR